MVVPFHKLATDRGNQVFVLAPEEMARAKNVEMPISAAVAAVLAQTMSVDQAIESLLTRPIKSE